MSTGDAISSALPWVIVIAVPGLFLLVRGWKHLSEEWRLRLGVPLLVPIALLTFFSAVIGVAFRVRFVSWLVIPLALWMAAGYVRSTGNLRHIAAATLLAVGVVAMVTRVTIDDHRVEDARGAAEYISMQTDVPVVGMVWYMARPVAYYLGDESATYLQMENEHAVFDYHEQLPDRISPLPSTGHEDPDIREQTNALANAVDLGEKYLLIYSRPFHGDPHSAFLSSRTAIDGLKPVAELAGITIYQGRRGL
ncbi:MAG: hypothetical protein HKN80_14755 [Acidimicrobiia bacterium]|nr:hypothetical protein [Acidimicrobiia bacterium]